jgi:NAD-dependent dihydropyrimidine dehydrogenase PreA subunit
MLMIDLRKRIIAEERFMAYVIAEPCVGTKDTACLDVCPVDAIHPRKDNPAAATVAQLYINADDCICCAACVPVCPAGAIYAEEDLPAKWKPYVKINRDYFGG